MSLKINNSLNISSQNLNQSSTFNNASCTIEDASKNLALAQRFTTDKNPTIQDVGQIVMDVAKLIDSAGCFIRNAGNISSGNNTSNSLNSAKKVTKISDRPRNFRPTMMPTARATNSPTSSPTPNATQTFVLTIERNVDTILFDKLKLQPSYSGQFSHNGEANKTFKGVSINEARDFANTGFRPYGTLRVFSRF